MRQVGIVAAAGRYALQHHVERLADDHANARVLADRVADHHPASVDPSEVTTNIVYVDTGTVDASQVVARLADDGVLVGAMGPNLVRLVTHLDVDRAGVEAAADRLVRALDGR